jgi:hypothetical protein
MTFDLDERALTTAPTTPTDDRFLEGIRELLPESTGVSVARIEDGHPYTALSSDEQVAALDAVQYIAGGPCVAAAGRGTPVRGLSADLSAQGPWRLFGRAASAVGIVETRSVPLAVEGRTVGTLNLYTTADDALGDWDAALEVGPDGISAPRAIRETSFTGRLGAALSPERLRDQNEVDWAVGLLSGLLGIDPADAGDRLRTAALRAGLDESSTARALNGLLAG